MRKLLLNTVLGAGFAFAATGGALAATISNWVNITNDGNTSVASQLAVDVTDAGSGQVNFRFTNAVGVPSSITDVYFDDKSVAVLALPLSLASSAGVAFGTPATPADLPGGNGAGFTTTAGFSADSNPAVEPNGVNAAAEWLDVRFNLAAGRTFADVISELTSGELVLGMHIQAIGTSGGSDSYINGSPPFGPPVIPAPASIALFGVALAGLGVVARRRSRA